MLQHLQSLVKRITRNIFEKKIHWVFACTFFFLHNSHAHHYTALWLHLLWQEQTFSADYSCNFLNARNTFSQDAVWKKALCTRCHCWERFLLSSLSVSLLLKFRYHFTLLHNTKLICEALHNVTFLCDYSIFYCFLYLIRISLIFSTSSTVPALITVLSFSQMSAHPVVLDTCTHTGDFHHPSSSPTSSKSQ